MIEYGNLRLLFKLSPLNYRSASLPTKAESYNYKDKWINLEMGLSELGLTAPDD